ncbi:uncharacterized protein LOC123306627 [Coccinella septempunctata]|uniref:uncharacterized protein LOC123306627 n=1 Tax=Coccinella septempunctata TaxID=41139 RepID=UPI001D0998FD|nr:uncharacterized protein LOC123306627 [Coccinella septempunctata]
MMSSTWCDSKNLQLIEEYRKRPCLWDPSDDYHKNMIRKNEAWNEIGAALECNVTDVKRKMASILASFRRERKRECSSRWYAFSHLSFLLDKFKTKTPSIKGAEEEDDSTEWWTEHDGLIDDPDLLNESELDDKSEIQIDTKENFSTQLIQTNNFDTFDNLPQTRRTSAPPPKKKARSNEYSNNDECGALNTHVRGGSGISPKAKSVSELFVAYLAAKLDTYTEHERNIVQHKINDVLFQADMGNFAKVDSLQGNHKA